MIGFAAMQTPLAQLTVEWQARTCLVTLTGEIDHSNSQQLSKEILLATMDAEGVVIIVDGLTYLDSAALTMVHELAQLFKAQFILVAPVGGRARRLLEIAGMDTFLKIVETPERALSCLNG